MGGHELKLPRSVAIAVVYIVIGAGLYMGGKLIWPQLSQQVAEIRQNWDDYIKSGSEAANNFVSNANTWMRRLRLPQQWRDYLTQHMAELAKSSVPLVESIVAAIVGYLPYLTWLILVPILSFFFLRDGESFAATRVALLPNERLRKRASWLLLDVSNTMAAYIRAQITSCLAVGTMATIGFYLMRAPYAVVLGAVTAVCEFVPMAGPFVAGCIAFGVGLTVSFKMALAIAVFLIILRIAQDYFIYPKIIGRGIKMHPLLVILAIFGGAEVGGLIGIFLAVPFIGLIIVAYHHYAAYRGLQNLKVVLPTGEVEGVAEVQLTTDEVGPEVDSGLPIAR
jgi:predicted PurR-regulated permease PerM